MTARFHLLIPALIIVLLAACSGGGGSVAGIDRLGISSGTVTGFGSVIVNGVRYEVTGGTLFDVDDAPGTQDDLDVGDQVTVRWTDADGSGSRRALEVSAGSAVRGPISAIDPVTRQIVVLGQTVQITGSTSFDKEFAPRDITGLTIGQTVRVTGLVEAGGLIRATRIDTQGPAEPLLVRGTATGVTAQTLVINGLTVNYATAQLPDGVIVNGNPVKVTGNGLNGLGQLVATVVEKTGSPSGGANAGDRIEVEGFITRFVSAADFDVAGVRVSTSASTRYDDGSAASLALNVRVEVEGTVNASGVLVAREIDFKSPGDDDDDDPDGRVAANVTAVNPGAGSLVAAGVTIVVSPATRLEDQSAAGLRPFRAADINVGDFVDVRGAPGIGASLSALLLERDDASDEGRLHGPASAIAQPDLTVLGVPVTSSGATQFRDRNGNTVTATQFFQALTPGTRVRVRFSQSAQAGGAILANRLELEELDANVSCPPDPGPVLIEGNVTVTGNCTLNGTRVLGNVRVYGGGSLTTFGADIDGNIQANGASFVLVEQTAVNGDIQLDDMAGSAGSVINSTVDGNIQVFDNDVPLVIRDNLVGGDVQAFGNQGGVAINDNDINGNLQCQGNTPPPTGGNNQVNGNKENQCSGL